MKRISSDTPLSPACRMIEQFGSRWALLVLLTLEQHGTCVTVLCDGISRAASPNGCWRRHSTGWNSRVWSIARFIPRFRRASNIGSPRKPPRCCPFCTNCSRGQRHTQSDAADPRNHPKMKSEARERQLKTPRKRTLTEVRTHIRRKGPHNKPSGSAVI